MQCKWTCDIKLFGCPCQRRSPRSLWLSQRLSTSSSHERTLSEQVSVPLTKLLALESLHFQQLSSLSYLCQKKLDELFLQKDFLKS